MAGDKITSIAELKKAIGDVRRDNSMIPDVIIDLINEFEASVKDELGSPSPPIITEYTKNDAYANGYFAALRKILGDDLLRRAEREATEVRRLSRRVLARVRGEE